MPPAKPRKPGRRAGRAPTPFAPAASPRGACEKSTYPPGFPVEIQYFIPKKFGPRTRFSLPGDGRFATVRTCKGPQRSKRSGKGLTTRTKPLRTKGKAERKGFSDPERAVGKPERATWDRKVASGSCERVFGPQAHRSRAPARETRFGKASGGAARPDAKTASEHLAPFPILQGKLKRDSVALTPKPRRQRQLMHYRVYAPVPSEYTSNSRESTRCRVCGRKNR